MVLTDKDKKEINQLVKRTSLEIFLSGVFFIAVLILFFMLIWTAGLEIYCEPVYTGFNETIEYWKC